MKMLEGRIFATIIPEGGRPYGYQNCKDRKAGDGQFHPWTIALHQDGRGCARSAGDRRARHQVRAGVLRGVWQMSGAVVRDRRGDDRTGKEERECNRRGTLLHFVPGRGILSSECVEHNQGRARGGARLLRDGQPHRSHCSRDGTGPRHPRRGGWLLAQRRGRCRRYCLAQRLVEKVRLQTLVVYRRTRRRAIVTAKHARKIASNFASFALVAVQTHYFFSRWTLR